MFYFKGVPFKEWVRRTELGLFLNTIKNFFYPLFFLFAALLLVCAEMYARSKWEPPDIERELQFQEADPQLGWKNKPEASGSFSSKRKGYSANIFFDENGKLSSKRK